MLHLNCRNVEKHPTGIILNKRFHLSLFTVWSSSFLLAKMLIPAKSNNSLLCTMLLSAGNLCSEMDGSRHLLRLQHSKHYERRWKGSSLLQIWGGIHSSEFAFFLIYFVFCGLSSTLPSPFLLLLILHIFHFLSLNFAHQQYRKIISGWIMDVGEYFKLQSTTTHAAIAYLDRLQLTQFSRYEWQMLAISCILISGIYTNDYYTIHNFI